MIGTLSKRVSEYFLETMMNDLNRFVQATGSEVPILS